MTELAEHWLAVCKSCLESSHAVSETQKKKQRLKGVMAAKIKEIKDPKREALMMAVRCFHMQKELNSVTPSVGVARLSLLARDNTQAAHRLAITPDNSRLVVATSAGSLQVWDISDGAGSLLHTVYPDGPGEFLMGAVPV